MTIEAMSVGVVRVVATPNVPSESCGHPSTEPFAIGLRFRTTSRDADAHRDRRPEHASRCDPDI
jgi:hypothetical protein